MSRIGKKAIALPKGVTASVDGQTVKVMVSLKGFGRAMDALTAKAAAK